MHAEILKKIESNKEKIGIIGLGYVGLPLAVSFALKNVQVIGFEKSREKVKQLLSGKNYIADVEDEDLRKVVKSGTFSATDDFSRIAECDAVIICVPTPLDHFKKPDMQFIETACRDIGRYIHTGVFISLESTTYPTTTENVVKPIIG